LAVNDLTREKQECVRAVQAVRSLSLGRTSIKCQVIKGFCSSVFVSGTREFDTSEDVIHSVGMPVGNTPKCSFVLSWGSTDLN